MGIKKKIRSNLWGLWLINEYHVFCAKYNVKKYLDEEAVNRYYKKLSGHLPDLENPQTFSEKLQWLKLNNKITLKEQCADKYDVREYIIGCGYSELLNDVYAVYDNVEDIELSKLPKQFVLKGAHGSGFNLIVKDKNAVNWKMWKRIMKTWLKQDIYWSGREWVYKNLKHRIIAEKYLEDETGELRDYKFFCFNGIPRFMQLEVGRFSGESTRNFYDMEWNLLPFGKEKPHNAELKVEVPVKFKEMQEIAKNLSKPFEFVRVDLYEVKGKIYFGELTFFPAGGAPDFVPSKYDKIVGDMLDLK